MPKTLIVALLVVAGLCTGTASACRGHRQVPEHGHAEGHEVLAVEVTGIHLTAHEAYRAAALGLQPWPVAPDGEDVLFPVGSTPTFTVDVLVHDSTGPAGAAVRTLTLGGCGVRVPALRADP
jgi:hypothetical protein